MSNSYYNHTTYPTPNSPGSSATLRLELENITTGFALLPTLAANGYKVAMINSAGTALVASAALQSLAITSWCYRRRNTKHWGIYNRQRNDFYRSGCR